MALPPYPLVNGRRFDWSSVKVKVKGTTYIGIKAVNYKQSLKPGVVMGTSPQPIGHTLGVYEPEAGMEMYFAEWEDLKAALGDGYMAAVFDVIVQYSVAKGQPVITDEIRGVRITAVDKSFSQSGDPLSVKLDLFVMGILENGAKPLPEMLGV